MGEQIDGGCLCGGLRYRLREKPVRISNCHCIDCRRGSAAAAVTWGVVRPNEVEILLGDVRRVRHANRLRSFAACCGTPLFFQDNENSPTIDVTIASLDHPEAFAPAVEIWTEDRLPWVSLNEELKSYPQGRSSI